MTYTRDAEITSALGMANFVTNMKTFEQYLNELHAEQYHGLDDDMPEDFNDWLEQFDATAMMGLAESYGELIQK